MNVTPSSRPCLPRNLSPAGPSTTVSQPSTKGSPAIFEIWDKWAAGSTRFEWRLAAVSAVRRCVENQDTFLDLSFLGLTDLPGCFPVHILELDVSANKLKMLPDTLPPLLKDLEASNNKLQSLPDTLPDSIERLDACGNRLVNLPATLPRSLRSLRLTYNRIENLPDQLPASLKVLLVDRNSLAYLPAHLPGSLESINASCNQLLSLPAPLPDGLRSLQVEMNRLERLPDKLPAGLKFIDVDRNEIGALPAELPPALEELHACFNRLTRVPAIWPPNLTQALFGANQIAELPEETFTIPHAAHLQFNQNPLTQETHDRLNQRDIELRDRAEHAAALTRVSAALVGAVCVWFPAEQHAEAVETWRKVAEEPGAVQFTRFLRRLSHIIGVQEAGFRTEVAKWLLVLPQSPLLLKATFLIAFDAAETCEDRAALALSQMWAAGFVCQAETGAYDSEIPEFVRRARRIFRLEMLADVACEKVIQMRKRVELRGVDEISIYLGYEVKLNKDLQLESPIRAMRFFDSDCLSKEELVRVWLTVMENENVQFPSWLSCWSPWERMLERQDRTGYERMYEDLHQEVEQQFQSKLATALHESGLENDEDARRLSGPMVMKRVEHDIKTQFTRDFLGTRDQLSLLDHFWSDLGASFEVLKRQAKIAEILDR